MAQLYQDGDKVIIDCHSPVREMVVSIKTAGILAGGLERLSAFAATAKLPGPKDSSPHIAISAIINHGRPLVRLVFGWKASRFYLDAGKAWGLAENIRTAAFHAEKALRWREDRSAPVT